MPFVPIISTFWVGRHDERTGIALSTRWGTDCVEWVYQCWAVPSHPSEPSASVDHRRREFGLRIRELRRDRSWTQEELAHAAGLDRKTINRLEQGRHSPAIDRVFLLADALGVRPGSLFDPPRRPVSGTTAVSGTAAPRRSQSPATLDH
jgi:DNA-binding XRE family transcriptional regulator